jgi:hypothetical protein
MNLNDLKQGDPVAMIFSCYGGLEPFYRLASVQKATPKRLTVMAGLYHRANGRRISGGSVYLSVDPDDIAKAREAEVEWERGEEAAAAARLVRDAEEAHYRAAVDRIWKYIDCRRAKPLIGIGDSIHAIHGGPENGGAELTFSDLVTVFERIRRGEL